MWNPVKEIVFGEVCHRTESLNNAAYAEAQRTSELLDMEPVWWPVWSFVRSQHNELVMERVDEYKFDDEQQ